MPVSGVSLDYPSSGERISTGIKRLDRLSGGGYQCGATALISGATGTGKTTLVCSFVREACARGEKVLYVSFEESASILISNMLSPGIDLRPAAQTGHLEFLARMPESVGVEQHLYDVLQGIEEFQPQHVVVDAISACHRMGSERAAFDYLVRLINMAREQGLTLVMTNQLTHNDVAGDVSDFGIASLVDTIVILRYAEQTEAVGRILQIYKNRGSKHSNGRHQYSITDDGIEIHDGAGQGMSTTEPSEREAEGPVR
jgi:circadian clock protein KaiC